MEDRLWRPRPRRLGLERTLLSSSSSSSMGCRLLLHLGSIRSEVGGRCIALRGDYGEAEKGAEGRWRAGVYCVTKSCKEALSQTLRRRRSVSARFLAFLLVCILLGSIPPPPKRPKRFRRLDEPQRTPLPLVRQHLRRRSRQPLVPARHQRGQPLLTFKSERREALLAKTGCPSARETCVPEARRHRCSSLRLLRAGRA